MKKYLLLLLATVFSSALYADVQLIIKDGRGGLSTVSSDGKEVAYDAVRIKLQEIVDGEDKQKPFSDDELVRQLDREGLKVARRTVTKYRKSMGIGSSRQRREWRDDDK